MEEILYNNSNDNHKTTEKMIKDLMKDMEFNQKIIIDFRDNYLKDPLENSYNDKIEVISFQKTLSNLLNMFEKSIIVTLEKLKIIQSELNSNSLKTEFDKKNNNTSNLKRENKNNFTQKSKIINPQNTKEKKSLQIDNKKITNSNSTKIIYNDNHNNIGNNSGNKVLNNTENNNNNANIFPGQKKRYYFNFNYDNNKNANTNKAVKINSTKMSKNDLLNNYSNNDDNNHNTNDFIGKPNFQYETSNIKYNSDVNKYNNYRTIANKSKRILESNSNIDINNENLTIQNYSNNDIIFSGRFNKNYSNYNNYNNNYNHNYNIDDNSRGENGQIRNYENYNFHDISKNMSNNFDYSYKINEINNNNSNNDLNIKNSSSISHSIRPHKNHLKLTNIKSELNNNERKTDTETRCLREVLRKLKKNPSFNKNYYNNNNNKNETILNRILNSQNLILYFSEKYGKGDLNLFITKFDNKELDIKIIENEIKIISKVIENDNNDTTITKKNNNKDHMTISHQSSINNQNHNYRLPRKICLKKNKSQINNCTKISKNSNTTRKNIIKYSNSKETISNRASTPSIKSTILTKRKESDNMNVFLSNNKISNKISTIYGSSSRVCPLTLSKNLKIDEYNNNNNKEQLINQNIFSNNTFCNRVNYRQSKTPLNTKNNKNYSISLEKL